MSFTQHFEEEFVELEKKFHALFFTFFSPFKNILDILKYSNPLWPTFRLSNDIHLQSLKP